MVKPTKYELETYEGRKISEERELGLGYCGSCSLEIHVDQVRNPKSWVNSRVLEHWHKDGSKRTLVGEYEDDNRFFVLKKNDGRSIATSFIIQKKFWWLWFAPPAAIEKVFGEKLGEKQLRRNWGLNT